METNERNERRQRMLEKVRKLLAMANDGRGNENEAEIAMRQANRIMAEYGIDEAEADMSAIDAGDMVYGEAQCTPDGKAPEPGKVARSFPNWAGVLAIGVSAFTDSVVIRRTTSAGQVLVFQGEKNDVLLARWLFGVLVHSINAEQKLSGWTKRGESVAFRGAAAATLQRRLHALHAERQAMYRKAQVESQSRALVVVDRKAVAIAERFGKQQVSHRRGSYSSVGAYQAGQEAGARINIPAGRPIAGASSRAQIGR